MTWPQWTNMLSGWQWGVLAAVPLAILALYFLKLKRAPQQVPSTYLWQKSIEDLHVNSIWQRLRRSLLLFLQLLLIALLALVLLRPSWQGSPFERGRIVILIDTSASMRATDVAPSRLDEAKRRAQELIDQMGSGDVAMIVSFADVARVEQMFTDNRAELRRRLELIQPTDKPTSIAEALRVASVLANPTSQEHTVGTNAEPLPAQMFLFSDGNFADVPDFSLGNLTLAPPVWIGSTNAANLAIVAFSAAPSENDATKLHAFGRVQNSGPADAERDVELHLDGELVDAQHLSIPTGKNVGVSFTLENVPAGRLELRLAGEDALAVDDRAWAVVRAARRSRVLLVTPGNEPLQSALQTPRATEIAEIARQSPEYLTTNEYRQGASTGIWDLIIYDRCQPETPPQANTLYFDHLPQGGSWEQQERVSLPQVIDVNKSHPLMQWLDLSDVLIMEARPVVPPAGSTALIESTGGILMAIAPREGYEDVVTAFPLVADGKVGTNWPVRPSFPVFVLNTLEYLGGNRDVRGAGNSQPGHAIALRPETDAKILTIVPPRPDAVSLTAERDKQNIFHFAATHWVGLYRALAGEKIVDWFAVNLFDLRESDIRTNPDRQIEIGHRQIASAQGWEETRRDGWKFVLLAAVAILVLEWYIYNRRAYL